MSESPSLMSLLLQALKLEGRPITRLVILCEADEPPQVYYVETLDPRNMAQAAQAMSNFCQAITPEPTTDVAVDGNGNVFIEVQDGGDGTAAKT